MRTVVRPQGYRFEVDLQPLVVAEAATDAVEESVAAKAATLCAEAGLPCTIAIIIASVEQIAITVRETVTRRLRA